MSDWKTEWRDERKEGWLGTEEELSIGREIVLWWGDSDGKGPALSIQIAKAISSAMSEGARRAGHYAPWWFHCGLGFSIGLTCGLAIHITMGSR